MPVKEDNQIAFLIKCFSPGLSLDLQLEEQELIILLEHLSSPPVFSGVRVTRSFSFMCMFCRSLFVLLSFFYWPLY